MFSKDLIKQNQSFYVVQRNMKLSKFDLQSIPSEFSKVIPLEFSPSSVAPSDSLLAVFGTPNMRNASKNELDTEDLKAIHLVNKDGQQNKQFGDTYDIDGQWMLLQPFVSDGIIKYSATEDVYIMAYKRFPYLYVFDGSTFNIKSTFKFSDFELGHNRYWPEQGRLEVLMEDNSAIRNIRLINEKYLWVEIENRQKTNEQDNSWNINRDYYVINLGKNKSYHLGKFKVNEQNTNQQFYLTDDGLVIQKEGNLYIARDKN